MTQTSAVPTWWPTTGSGDGGAHHAAGGVAVRREPADELAAHRAGRTLAIFADNVSIEAFGRNPLDPGRRASSAIAGRRQGRQAAAELGSFLGVR
ncbi:MAG TPA: hypothetical protein VMU34_02865 [Mycobacterium sp.]|nr:hypothetical protein [Mycobacterium sp.]